MLKLSALIIALAAAGRPGAEAAATIKDHGQQHHLRVSTRNRCVAQMRNCVPRCDFTR